jgi:hypothetical protein
MPTTRTLITSDFRPIIDARLSSVPDLYEWARKQPTHFWDQYRKMSLESMQKAFPPYCPHCQLDRRCMTLLGGRPSAVTKGICIQCLYFLKTGKRGGSQR